MSVNKARSGGKGMEVEKGLLIGIDLDNELLQAAVYDEKAKDAVNIILEDGSENPCTPVCLLMKESTKEWVSQSVAKEFQKLNGGIFVSDLLEHVKNKETRSIYGINYTGNMLLKIYLKKILSILRLKFFHYKIEKLAVTVDDKYREIGPEILEILQSLGVKKEQLLLFSRGETFMYYLMNQSKDLWLREATMLALEQEHCTFYQMTVDRQVTPSTVVLEKNELLNEYSLDKLSTLSDTDAQIKVEQILNQLLYHLKGATLFLTGKGARKEWTTPILRNLCKSRRVFQGQNLYVKGACYGARTLVIDNLKEYMMISDEMTRSTISVRLTSNDQDTEVVLSKAQTPWWQVNTVIEVILDDTIEIPIVVKNCMRRNPIIETMTLDGLTVRENKTICLSLQLYYVDRDTPILTVRDMGFGEYYPTTYRIWEQRLQQ